MSTETEQLGTAASSRPVTNSPSWFSADLIPKTDAVTAEHLQEFRSRQARVREALRSAGLDAIVTAKQSNLRYLSGYATVAAGKAALVITPRGAFLAVSESELGRALVTPAIDGIHVFGWDEPVDIDRWLRESDATKRCRGIVREWDGSVIGAKSAGNEALARLRARTELIDRIRMIASNWSAARMRRAGLATKAGVEAAFAEAHRSDATDADMAAAATSAMLRHSGYEYPAIVVVGIDRGAGIAHSQLERRVLQPGGVAFLEFSGGFDSYCAPVMRTIVREPVSDDVIFLFDRVTAILNTLYEEIKPGAKCSAIAAKCSAHLSGVDGLLFHYNYGYPVSIYDDKTTWMNGPDFHITAENDGILEAGMTFHLPIVLRRFGRYAVGQSQTIRVVEGGIEILTDPVPAGLLRIGQPDR